MTARFIVGDVFDGLATLEDGSVDLVVTSPPFLALRSYLPADHPDKDKEIGLEPTPAEFLDVLLRVTAELRRVLAPHGSICVELGDTYAGSGGAGGDYLPGGLRDGQEPYVGSAKWDRSSGRRAPGGQPYTDMFKGGGPGGSGWPLAKSKALIPELYRVALAYGINPLTGQESPAGRWRIRNVVTWCRPNPPVGALGDKWRPATSDIVVACTSDKRYWDDIATRRPAQGQPDFPSNGPKAEERERLGIDGHGRYGQRIDSNPAGAPLLDWHSPLADAIDRAAAEGFALGRHTTEPLFGGANNEVKETIGQRMLRELVEQGAIDSGDVLYLPPGGYPGSHYAVYPPALIEPLVKAMAPPKVCRTCGEPSRRIVDVSYESLRDGSPIADNDPWRTGRGGIEKGLSNGKTRARSVPTTAGFTDCGHDNWRPAVILDPFVGSGTTLAVATGHGHDAIGIDLDERNYHLALERVGPMLLGEPERVEGHLR